MLEFAAGMKVVQTSELPPVVTLVGTEYILKRMVIETLKQRMASESVSPPDVSKHYFDEEGCDSALLSCQTLSLFSSSNFVVLENFTAVLPNAKAKHDTTDLEKYIANPIFGSVLILVVPADKMDERKKLSKTLQKFPVIHCSSPKEDAVMEILETMVRSDGISISKGAMKELFRRRPSVTDCHTELQKLWTYTNHAAIETADVQELVAESPEDNVFGWIDAAIKGRIDAVFRTLGDIRRAGYDTFALLALIARQLRMMWFAKVLSDRGFTHPQIAAQAGAHPYAIKVASEQARQYSAKRLEALLQLIADGEFEAKTGRRDAEQVLDMVVLSLVVKK